MVSSAVTGMVVERIRYLASHSEAENVFGLTPREREIPPLIAAGQTNREIATELSLSDKTVKNDVSSISPAVGAI